MPQKKKSSTKLLNKKLSQKNLVIFIALFAVVGVFTLWQALAAKPSRGTGSSISLYMVTDNNSNGLPNWNDTVAFNVTSSYADSNGPWLNVACKQNGNLVYSASTGYGPDYPWPNTRNMPLSSNAWTSGAADCTATLTSVSKQGRQSTLATYSFHVDA